MDERSRIAKFQRIRFTIFRIGFRFARMSRRFGADVIERNENRVKCYLTFLTQFKGRQADLRSKEILRAFLHDC